MKELTAQAIALAVYIELQNGMFVVNAMHGHSGDLVFMLKYLLLGNTSGALEIIKKHQLLPPGNKANEKNRKIRKLSL